MSDSTPAVGPLRRMAVRALLAGATSALAAVVTVGAAATMLARRVVTPDRERPDDVEVLAVGQDRVTLAATVETVAAGRCGLWQDGGLTHARLGEVLSHDPDAGLVTRPVLGVDRGRLRVGPGRWNQYFHAGTPWSALGLPYREIEVDGGAGPLHGWLVEADRDVADGPADTWAILVHGRGATREECLRALPVLHRVGVTALVAGYRSTAGVPGVPEGRYLLGDAEWRDIEAAVLYAAEHGAAEIVLIGWSMGGAIALQVVSRSWTAQRIRGLVLNGPVLDWRHVLSHQARANRVPAAVGRLGQSVLTNRATRRLTGVEAPVDLNRLDWIARASELRLPILLIHSPDDDFVPDGPSRALAEARPDLVSYLDVPGARHTKEWNVDPDGWEAAVARFLLRL